MASLIAYTDVELTSLLKDGNKGALTEIHKRYYGLLYSHAYKRLPEREEVKDILQELFLYLWNNRQDLNLSTSLPAYLYTCVRNRILNVYKHKKVRLAYISSFQDFIDHGDSITDNLIREKELIFLVEKEVSSLPPQMRLIFEMSRNAQLSHIEIAQKLNISPLTVRKQVNYALKILRVKLGMHIFLLFF